ncbi:PAS domain-containing sensor histidine kinase [Fidelibacter multiformis]|uniref:PAS domain-containing sensor histidine kinase n=1 Tax=Fidelibacter multiformis TaxID=3377529 RepID=UPI0037DCBCCA
MNNPGSHRGIFLRYLIPLLVFILIFFFLESLFWFFSRVLDLDDIFWSRALYLQKPILVINLIAACIFSGGAALIIYRIQMLKRKLSEAGYEQEGLFNKIPFQVMIKDVRGKIVRVNQAVLDFYGLDPQDMLGKKEEEAIPGLKAKYFENNEYVYHKQTEKRGLLETRMAPDGHEKIIRTDRIPYFNTKGDFQGVMVFGEDVTSDVETAHQIRETSSRLEKIIESLQEGVTLSTPEGHFEIYNSQMRDITGYTREQANRTRDFINLIYPDPNQRQIVLDAIEDMQKTGRSHETITEIVTRDRQHKLILVSSVLVAFNDKIRFLSTYRDVTDVFHIQEQVNLFSRAVEQGASSVLIADRNGYIQYSNSKFSEISGFDRDDIVGQRIGFHFVRSSSNGMIDEMMQHMHDGEEWQGEFECQRKNGDVYWNDINISPIADTSGEITHFIIIENDITERRRMIEMLKNARDISESANRAKTEFLANMSHELRTPLNSIIGFTNILLKNEKKHFDERDTMFLNRIRQNGIQLLNILSDILEISMVESGKITTRFVQTDLQELLKEILHTYGENARKKGLEFNLSLPEKIQPFKTDPEKLKSIVDNLLSNAVKFTEKGSVSVTLNVNPNTGEPAELMIADTGPGIPKERHESIFKAFEQVDYSKSRKYGGTGLGLALANSYAELMNYQMLMNTRVDEGTTFTIRFY